MLQLVCFAKNTLTLEEFYVAFQHATGHSNDLPNVGNLGNIKRRLLYLTGGLLETYWILEGKGSKINRESWLLGNFQKISTVGEIHVSKPLAVELVSSIHRTVREYLGSPNWEDSGLRLMEQPRNAHELWLGICAKQFPPAFAVDPKPEIYYKSQIQDFVVDRGHRSSSVDKNVLKLQEGWLCEANHHRYLTKTSGEQSTLLAYAGRYIFDHAIHVEKAARVSCIPYMMDLTHHFLDFHDLIAKVDKSGCTHCIPAPFWGFLQLEFGPVGVAHRLLAHYLIGYPHSNNEANDLDRRLGRCLLQCCGILSVEPSQDRALTLGAMDSMKETVLRPSQPSADLARETLYFVVGLLRKTTCSTHRQSTVVDIALQMATEVEDTCFCIALEGANSELIERLLDFRPPGLFTLRLKLGYLTKSLYVKLDNKLPPFVQKCLSNERVEFRPLWFALSNYGYHRSDRDDVRMMRLFLDRGEELQKFCSPIGTALHAFVLKGESPALKELLQLGLDVHATGEFGNALELGWACAHERDSPGGLFPHRLNIAKLMRHGVAINRVDPNGFIPGLPWIKYFTKRAWECYACWTKFSDIYHGAGPYEENPDFDRHLCGKLDAFEETSDNYVEKLTYGEYTSEEETSEDEAWVTSADTA